MLHGGMRCNVFGSVKASYWRRFPLPLEKLEGDFCMIRNLLIGSLMALAFMIVAPVQAADVEELERRIDMLSDELDRVKGGAGGGVASRTSVHGYGELHMQASDENPTHVDSHRFVVGVHSELSDWIHLNMEMDFEHAMEELEFEFGYLDFLLSDSLNFRAGAMLMPMGNLNEFHEPPLFYSVERPDFHSKLIPTTWTQAGVGVFGQVDDGINYRLYLVNAVQSTGTGRSGNAGYFRDEDFIRKGRAQLNKIHAGDWAFTGRAEYSKISGADLGMSFYTGCSTQQNIDECGLLSILEADAKYRWRAVEFDASIMKGWVEDTKEINANATGNSNSNDVPSSAFGYVVQLALHVPQQLGWKTTHDLIPFVKYERIRPNDVIGEGATSSDRTKNFESWAFGVSYMPIKKVALKADIHFYQFGGKEVASGQLTSQYPHMVTVHNKETVGNLGVAYMY